MGRPKKVRPLVKVGVERAANLGPEAFVLQCGTSQVLTEEAWQRLLAIWARVRGEFLPRPDRLAGATFEDPWRSAPGSRPWMWYAERGLDRPRRDGEELLALKKLGVLVAGEWGAARARLRHMALTHWTSKKERNAVVCDKHHTWGFRDGLR